MFLTTSKSCMMFSVLKITRVGAYGMEGMANIQITFKNLKNSSCPPTLVEKNMQSHIIYI